MQAGRVLAAAAVALLVWTVFQPALRSHQSTTATPPAVAKLIADGFAHVDAGRLDEATAAFEQALAAARQQGLKSAEAESYRGLGRALAQKKDLVGARDALDRSLTLFEQVGDEGGMGRAWNQLGTNAYFEGKWDDARAAYDRALAAFGRAGLARDEANVLRNLTFLPNVPVDERLRLIALAVERARQAGDRAIEGLALHTWGDLLFVRADYAGARVKLDEALLVLEPLGNGRDLARLYTSLGRLYRVHGEPARALPYYERALERQRALRDVAGESQTLNAMALATNILDRPTDALALYEQALALAQKAGLQASTTFVMTQLGTFHAERGNPAKGAALLEEALKHEKSVPNRTFGLAALSKAYSALGRHTEAESAAEEAVRLARDQGELDGRRAAYFTRALARRTAGRPADALEDARELLRVLERQRPSLVPADSLRLGFGERVRYQFDFAVSLLVELGYVEEALVATEQGRARAFLDLLASHEVAAKPANALTSDSELRSFASAQAPSLDQLKQTASRLQSTVLSYWVTPQASFVWVVERDGSVHSGTIPVSASRLTDLVHATWSGPASSPGGPVRGGSEVRQDQLALGGTANAAWRQLYDLLIVPIRSWVPRADGNLLTIVPDGPLYRLSFAALRNERGRYLLEGYRLHYTSALSVLEFTARKKQTAAPEGMLLVANPSLPKSLAIAERLAPLPGAAREARAIARVHNGRAVQLLVGPNAGEARVRADARDRTTLHFAAHSVVRDDRPMESFLALAGGATDPANDGRLTALEIYGLDLKASLVVLSACRSAGGKITGDGIVGLTRAFIYAGVPSVVASVWDLPDETAPWLFEKFYRARDSHGDVGAALRAAQLELLRALRTGKFTIRTSAGTFVVPEHPALWAGLQLWGEPS